MFLQWLLIALYHLWLLWLHFDVSWTSILGFYFNLALLFCQSELYQAISHKEIAQANLKSIVWLKPQAGLRFLDTSISHHHQFLDNHYSFPVPEMKRCRNHAGNGIKININNYSRLWKQCNTAQDRGPFWFSYILNEMLQHIEIWNEFIVWNHCPNF